MAYNAIHLEAPAKATQSVAEDVEASKLEISEVQKKQLEKQSKALGVPLKNEVEAMKKKKKRKGPKGPNPLSCKKPQKKKPTKPTKTEPKVESV